MSASYNTIRLLSKDDDVSLYRINRVDNGNRYYILSSAMSRKLLAYPEVVSMDTYYALLKPTEYAIRHLLSKGDIRHPEICTILRGGLNYPLEEAGYNAGMSIANIHFLSCERIIENNIITGLEVKYDKLQPNDGATLMIGDILASGMTLKLCFHKIIEAYKKRDCCIRRIIFFTIGGTRAFDIFDKLSAELKVLWPEFEGVDCFFYEGTFSVYESKGVLGFQVPEIDFYWNGGLVAPEYRQYCMEHITPIMEKCVIYDGGARRYNIPEHRTEVLEYWKEVEQKADTVDVSKLLDERIGYSATDDYGKWIDSTGYQELDSDNLKAIFESEKNCRRELLHSSLQQIAQGRITEIAKALSKY